MPEPITLILALGGVVALGVMGDAAVKRAAHWRAMAKALGGRYVGGSWPGIVVAKGHVLVHVPRPGGPAEALVNEAHVQWALGPGPDFVLGHVTERPFAVDRVGQELALEGGWTARAYPASAFWLLRESLSPDALGPLMRLDDAGLHGDGRRVTFSWTGDVSAEVLAPIVERLAALASAGLAPLEAAEGMDDAEVRWPSGPWNSRTVPVATLRKGGTVGRLRFARHHWHLTGSFDSRWPSFTGTVARGTPAGDWPKGILRQVATSLADLDAVEVRADGDRFEITFAQPPDRAALRAGLALLARASAPPPSGVFR